MQERYLLILYTTCCDTLTVLSSFSDLTPSSSDLVIVNFAGAIVNCLFGETSRAKTSHSKLNKPLMDHTSKDSALDCLSWVGSDATFLLLHRRLNPTPSLLLTLTHTSRQMWDLCHVFTRRMFAPDFQGWQMYPPKFHLSGVSHLTTVKTLVGQLGGSILRNGVHITLHCTLIYILNVQVLLPNWSPVKGQPLMPIKGKHCCQPRGIVFFNAKVLGTTLGDQVDVVMQQWE